MYQSQDATAPTLHAYRQRTQDGVSISMDSKASFIQDTVKRLRLLRVETQQKVAELEKKSRQYDMLHDLTPQQEDEADALCQQQDTEENKLDAIDAAIDALQRFNVLK